MNGLSNDETVRLNSPPDALKRMNSPPIFASSEHQNFAADSVMVNNSSITGSATFRLPIKAQWSEPLARADTYPKTRWQNGAQVSSQNLSYHTSPSGIQIPLLKIPGTYRPPMMSNLDLMPQSARIPGYAGHLPGLTTEPLVGRSFAYLTAYREALITERQNVWTTEYKERHLPSLLFKKKSERGTETPKHTPKLQALTPGSDGAAPRADSLALTSTSANSERSNWGSPPEYTAPAPPDKRRGPGTPDLYAVERDEQAAALSGAGRIPGYAGHERGLVSSGLVGRTFGFLTRHREELIRSHR